MPPERSLLGNVKQEEELILSLIPADKYIHFHGQRGINANTTVPTVDSSFHLLTRLYRCTGLRASRIICDVMFFPCEFLGRRPAEKYSKTWTPACSCSEPPETGLCKALFNRYYYDYENHTCYEFIYGGCGGNCNNYEIESCALPPVSGRCLAYMPRYYFDPETKSCARFIYGGCLGNCNKFISDDSKAIVLSEGSTLADICLLPADVGPCRAAKPRYYYDTEAKACVKFRYGGCYGNCNNFATVEKCEMACPTKIKSFR
uniref:BPTI/Kunitz inhibitor domain-containing protein n=1 Tax=Timema tahoe TaxID=61484 RepID=A0A7R9FH15_9NEOP|nr:unnamed protein product [Timema tahoe]